MKKDLLALGFVLLIIALLVSGTKIQSVAEYYLTHIDRITPDSKTVTISIQCKTILDNWANLDPELKAGNYVPADGVILPPTKYVLREGDTAFDLLDRAVRYNRIQMEYQGANYNSFKSVYVQGLNYLYEFSCGPLSGWMYVVNKKFPEFGCSKYLLRDGDVIEWIYTCDLGRDVGCLWLEEDKQS